MSRIAVLARILLCLAVLLNAAGLVHAMPMKMATALPAEAHAQAASDALPCHGADTASQADERAEENRDAPDPSDCCQSGRCDGACGQHAPALARLAPPACAQPAASTVPEYLPALHAPPALPHRHRPPILAA